MNVLDRLNSFNKQHALFQPDERVLLAVSGGRDSVLMVHLFNEAGFTFGIAHCNFSLRGDESDQDEQFVSNLAIELGVPFFTTTFNTKQYAEQHHISIQMAARDLRYQWLDKIRNDFGFHYIGLAHHHNDVIETMLLNLTRGTGIAGMHGILARKGKLIRPLLFLTRDEITAAVAEKGLLYREDSSNNSTKYARNKLRLEVIPVLKQLNPALESTFEANRRRFEELEIILEQRIFTLKEKLFKETTAGEYEIDLKELKELEPAGTLLYGLFHPFGFTETVLTDLQRSWDGESGKMFHSAIYELNLDRNKLILSRKKDEDFEPLTVNEQPGSYEWNSRLYKSSLMPSHTFRLSKELSIAQIDFELLSFPLVLRPWRKGDRFRPLGANGTKKVSDFFVEQKIPVARKNDIGILENGNGEVVWIAGLRLDDRYKVTTNTKKVFIFEQFT